MNNETKQSLGSRAVACKGWRWMRGMTTTGGAMRIGDFTPMWCGEVPWHGDILPDLDDPATLGCLLSLVRLAWGSDRIVPSYSSRMGDEFAGWDCCNLLDELRDELHATEAAALVAALEAAP